MKYCPECKANYPDDLAMCPRDAQKLLSKPQPDGKPDGKGDPFIGITIAEKYRVERLLGKGGMGAVYEGLHLMLDRPVAIKVLHKNISADEKAAARFLREAKATAKLEHPNAVTIHDFGVLADGSAYLVMEFIKGDSLRHYLMTNKKVDLAQAVDWICQICSVVELAHKQGIIHRDLKPENVMLKQSPDGTVSIKVVDFGLAKLTSALGGEGHLTQTGEVMGTPHYMAPEYYEGEQIDSRADVYAIGIIFYEMLTGFTPFSGSMQSIIGGHLFKEPPPLFNAVPDIDPRINEVVLKALSKKRDERTPSAAQFAQDLKAAYQASLEQPIEQATRKIEEIPQSIPSQPVARHSTESAVSSASNSPLPSSAMQKPSLAIKQPSETRKISETPQPPSPIVALAEQPTFVASEQTEEALSFFDILRMMRTGLIIGSIIVAVLAICIVAFIIYKSQQSVISVKPLDPSQESVR